MSLMYVSFTTINFNFFQENKVINAVLNVFFLSKQIIWMFSDLSFFDHKICFLFKRSLTILNKGSDR